MPQQPSRVTSELVLPTPKGSAKPQPVSDRDTPAALAAPALGEEGRDPGPPLRQGKVSLNFRLDPMLHQRLRAVSHRTDVSIQQHVETAVRRYLDTMAP